MKVKCIFDIFKFCWIFSIELLSVSVSIFVKYIFIDISIKAEYQKGYHLKKVEVGRSCLVKDRIIGKNSTGKYSTKKNDHLEG
jgi:hypothetical protein